MNGDLDTSGSLQAYQGSIERIADPHLLDAIFPVFAFFAVILVPAALALWVSYRTVTERAKNADEI